MNEINYTFIIPHRNSPSDLQRCINSIPQRQDIEIIVVDDNSDKDKLPVIKRDDVTTLYINKNESKGAGRARNYGLREARGKWILFADCDDFYANNFLNCLDSYLDSECDLVYFDAYFSYDINEEKELVPNKFSNYIKEYLKNPTEEKLRSLKHSCHVPWNFMSRRKLSIDNNIYFEEVPKGNDAYFHHMIALNSIKTAAIDVKLYYWVMNKNSISHKYKNKDEYMNDLNHSIKITKLRILAKAWNTIPPFWIGFGHLAREHGLYFAFYLYFHKLICGIPWHIIFLHKLNKRK